MPNVTTKPVSVTMEPQLHAQLEARAKAESRSVSKHIVHLIKEDLKNAGIVLKALDPALQKLLKRGNKSPIVKPARPDIDYVTGERLKLPQEGPHPRKISKH